MTRTNAQIDAWIATHDAAHARYPLHPSAHSHPPDVALTSRVATLERQVIVLSQPVGVPVNTPVDHWAGIPFVSRPSSGPLSFDSLTNVVVSNKSFGPASIYPSSALRFTNCVNITIRDCDFDQLDWDAIDILDCTGRLTIQYNRMGTLLRTAPQGAGRRPDFMQLVRTHMIGEISYNKLRTGVEHEDMINMVDESGGLSTTALLEVAHNAFQGGNNGDAETSTSGSGTLLADNSTTGVGGHTWVHHNTYLNCGQVGVGMSMGVDCHVTDNVIYGAQRGNSNVGLYTPYTAGSPNPGGHEAARNRIWWKNAAGADNPLFDGGASGTVAGLSPQTNVLMDTSIDWTTLVVTL